MSYHNAKSGKTKIEEGLVRFYQHIKDKESRIISESGETPAFA